MLAIDHVLLLQIYSVFSRFQNEVMPDKKEELFSIKTQIYKLVDDYRSVRGVYGLRPLDWDGKQIVFDDDAQVVSTDHGDYVLCWVGVVSHKTAE